MVIKVQAQELFKTPDGKRFGWLVHQKNIVLSSKDVLIRSAILKPINHGALKRLEVDCVNLSHTLHVEEEVLIVRQCARQECLLSVLVLNITPVLELQIISRPDHQDLRGSMQDFLNRRYNDQIFSQSNATTVNCGLDEPLHFWRSIFAK
jgi:hypothetical protein